MSLPHQPLMLPQPGRYRHYKGGLYDVLGTAVDEADGADVRVIYRPALSAATLLYSRRLERWCEVAEVDVDGKRKRVPRFVKVASPGEALALGEDWP